LRIENVRNCYTMLCYDTTRYDLFMIPIPLGAVSGNSGSVSLLLLLDGMLVCDGEYQNIETLLRSRLRSNRTAHSGSNRRQATSSNQRPVMPRPTHCRRGEKEARYAVVRTSSIYRNEPCSGRWFLAFEIFLDLHSFCVRNLHICTLLYSQRNTHFLRLRVPPTIRWWRLTC
jgi:hypothetical protein